ncbi:hypothetical protein COCNU_scaffold015308G000010 [Cocos nucifera]|nr:hypothetical protein [Cocos nucifera]
MKDSVLLHIVDKMVGKEDAKKFDESFAAFLELGHYLFTHLNVAILCQVEFSKAHREAQAETERIQTQLGHYLFTDLNVAILCQVEFSKAHREAQAETERIQTQIEHLKMASEGQTVKADRLREELRREEELPAELRAALSLGGQKKEGRRGDRRREGEGCRGLQVLQSDGRHQDCLRLGGFS